VLIETKKLRKNFGGLEAVAGVDFGIGAGELRGLIGPNGSGKSTFLNVISGILKADGGEVKYDNTDITNLKAHLIARKGIGRTFQAIRIFPEMTVLDNAKISGAGAWKVNLGKVLLGYPSSRKNERVLEEKCREILDFVGLGQVENRVSGELPFGLLRRVEIARALCLSPRVLLLDEPATGMNPMEKQNLMDVLKRINKEQKIAIILVEHDMKFLMGIVESVTVFDHGEKIVEGFPKDVASHPRVIESYLGAKKVF